MLATGIGGSETAAIHMARCLAARGHEVICLGDHLGYEGVHDGATYQNFQRLLDGEFGTLDCDVFISSRDKRAHQVPVKAGLKVLWVHDIHVGDDWSNDLNHFDRILCLSQQARTKFLAFYPQLPPAKVVLTRNGIDASLYAGEQAKDFPPRFTYSSSPDRGLETLVYLWPRIRDIAPGASLHVYYGFENWKKMAKADTRTMMKIAFFEQLLSQKEEEGIFYHGRVGQQELANSQMRSSLWLYPTAFFETYCITALEAQAAGALPVTTALGALIETVKVGRLINGRNTSDEYQQSFLECTKELLTNSQLREISSKSAREWALQQTWENLAKEWETMFLGEMPIEVSYEPTAVS
jgi:glycosyltransferase involved in cell wall biosynthesis